MPRPAKSAKPAVRKSPGSPATGPARSGGLSHFDASRSGRHGRCQRQAAHPPHRHRVGLRRALRRRPRGPARQPQGQSARSRPLRRHPGRQAHSRPDSHVPSAARSRTSTSQAEIVPGGVRITATAATVGPTGVEMEALTAASVAALTVYDMTKALDKAIVIRNDSAREKIRRQIRRLHPPTQVQLIRSSFSWFHSLSERLLTPPRAPA